MRCGVDTGGTFTDVVGDDGRVVKVLSTPADPSQAVADGLAQLGGPIATLAHGTTVATNALLQRRLGTVALVTNEGLEDVIEIGRQDRPSLYDQRADRPAPLVPRSLRFGVGPDEVPALPDAVSSVAVCLLHSDLDPGPEQKLAEALRARGHEVTCSSDVSPEFREYERTLTTVVNAALRPVCGPYLLGLADLADGVRVMTSAGGLVDLRDAADLPAALLLSGPAGGVLAAAEAARANGFPDAVTFDMGGTSTDVCLVLGGAPEPAQERTVAGFALRLPALDVHTIGAGGGSVAAIDPGGALVVGPESAGANPGPACYGRGGTRPTVTDADLVLGHIRADTVLPGIGPLHRDAAVAALNAAAVTASGVVAVVDAAMERAVRTVSVERGVNPTGLALVAFGGAGPVHACAVADALGMPAVVVPARAGVLSAVGLLVAPAQRDLVRSWPTPAVHEGLGDALAALGEEAAGLVGPGAAVDVAVDCRYAGQGHELTVPTVDAFHAEHQRRNGFARPGTSVEVIALRARARLASPVSVDDLPAPAMGAVVGPDVIPGDGCTIVVPDGWRGEPGVGGALVLRRVGAR